MVRKTTNLIEKAKYKAQDSGIQTLERSFWFILKFFTYDEYTANGMDYPIASAFEKIYSSTEAITIMFPNQVILSQRRPRIETRLDHLEEVGSMYEFPSDTYAYTTTTDQVYFFNKPVSIESFWLRLHQAP